jgi:nodulation protein E
MTPFGLVITGLGAVAGNGVNVPDFWSSVLAGQTAIRPWRESVGKLEVSGLAAPAAGFVAEDHFDPRRLRFLDRFAQMGIAAARQAVADAKLDLAATDLTRVAVVIGAAVAGEQTREQATYGLYTADRRSPPSTIPRVMHNAAASGISIDLGFKGPTLTTATACASSAHAIAIAADLIRNGSADVAVAGGAETLPSVGLWLAWNMLRVTTATMMRPFSLERDGFAFGEGSGVVVIESKEHAERRGASVYCELAGTGMSSDAHDLVEPSPDGMASAMRVALSQAGLSPEDIDYVNAHGTGTQANDRSETMALKSVFGAHAAKLAVSSTKGVHGHAMGATSALEMVATAMAVREQAMPPTANFLSQDPQCDLDYIPNVARKAPVRAAISNSFAFGGLNVCIALRAAG